MIQKTKKIYIFSTGLILIASLTFGQTSKPLSKNAPTDKPVDIVSAEQNTKLDKQIAPYVEQARKTLPEAKKKFLKGLNKGETFYLTTRIFDKDKKFEQIFIRVTNWKDDNIEGSIASDLNVVKEYKPGQLIKIKEKEILDWLISKPDGSEEGNFVGKYLDTLH